MDQNGTHPASGNKPRIKTAMERKAGGGSDRHKAFSCAWQGCGGQQTFHRSKD